MIRATPEIVNRCPTAALLPAIFLQSALLVWEQSYFAHEAAKPALESESMARSPDKGERAFLSAYFVGWKQSYRKR